MSFCVCVCVFLVSFWLVSCFSLSFSLVHLLALQRLLPRLDAAQAVRAAKARAACATGCTDSHPACARCAALPPLCPACRPPLSNFPMLRARRPGNCPYRGDAGPKAPRSAMGSFEGCLTEPIHFTYAM
jgi:hypothetical protein